MITKTNRTIIYSSLFLIICISAIAQERPTDSSQGVIGTWEGTLDAGAAKYKLVLHINASKEGPLVARLDVPDQNATDLPIDSLSVSGSTLNFELKSLGAMSWVRLTPMAIRSPASLSRVARRFPSLSIVPVEPRRRVY